MVKITIITVCYNACSTIKRTIESVISQTYSNIEYIIIDGNSKDGSQEIIEEYKNHISYYLSEPDKGIYDGMNKGIIQATGDYTLFLNTDDTLYNNTTIEDFVKNIKEQSDVYYGNNKIINEYGEYINKPRDITLLNRKWVLSHQATFIKTKLLKDNLFDINYRYCADYKQISNLYLNKYTFTYIDLTIATTPISSGTTYNNYIASTREHFRIIKERGDNVIFLEYRTIFLRWFVRSVKILLPKAILNPLLRIIAKYKVI